jgi:hypothetical protein
VSSADRDAALAGQLIERLLVDPGFRAEFRRDPAAACLAAGLPDLAAELAGSGGTMDTLVVRESRSSLAGVVMAVAVEGMSVAEAQALMHHGLTGAPRGLRLPHGGALPGRVGHLGHGHVSGTVQHELRGLHSGSPAHALGASASHTSGPPTTPSSTGSGSSASAPPTPAAAPASAPAASAPGTPPPTLESAPPNPGAQPVDGGVVPAWPDQQAGGGAAVTGAADGGGAIGAGGAPGGLAELVNSPRLSAPPDVRTFLTSGGADPRMVSVLDSALANHTIGLGPVTAASDPVHAQAVSIVSVDGQPVGPSNFAARDLVTEIAALDPSLRPTEIGTPWPIHSPGFVSDPAQQGQLHLAFASSSDYQPGARAGAGAGVSAGASAGAGALSPVPAPESAPLDAAAAPAAVEPTDTPAPATATSPPPPSGSGYVNPLPASAHIGRTDMGVDANMNPGDPIVAPGNSRVVGITPNWYRGQPYVALQLLDGPMKGHNYYLAEQITPNVAVGQIVQQGQPIAHYAASGTGIEMGWAGPNWEQTLAQATSGYSEGEQTAAGGSFRDFLDGLAHHQISPSSAPDSAVPDPDANAGVADPDAGAAVPAPAATTAAPPPAGAPPFTVLESRHHGVPRHTVQFLPAVQPSPGSPLYGQAPTPAPTDPPTTPAVTDTPGGSSVAQPPVAEPVLDQVAAAAGPTGGSISVNSSLLTPGQAKFAGRLAELTGLDPRVVAAWELAEESGSAAQGREAASNFNWLNIGYFDSGAGKIAFDKEFGDPISAAEQTAKFLKGDWGGASSSIRAILSSVGHSPDEQMSAIAHSDWASSHYGGGANLHGTYNELGDIQIEKSGTA